jgi:hypothetical protein
MKKKLNLLIVGSNFGKVHLKAAINSKKFKEISISSPNIHKKKISKLINKYNDFKKAILYKNFDMITIATKPRIQNEVLKFIYKNKKFPKYIFLEKPILDESIKILKKFPYKFLFLTNFIFSFNDKWINFKKKINKIKSFNYFKYEWFFKQAYFVNNKKTWKTNPTLGGGLINFYLPHSIFNILNNFKEVKFIKINKRKYYKKKLVYLDLIFYINQKYCNLIINNNSETNLHKLTLNTKNIEYLLINKTKKWLSNFKILKNDKEIIKQKKNDLTDGRDKALFDIYSNLNIYFSLKNVVKNKSITYKTFNLINLINKKIDETYI